MRDGQNKGHTVGSDGCGGGSPLHIKRRFDGKRRARGGDGRTAPGTCDIKAVNERYKRGRAVSDEHKVGYLWRRKRTTAA